MRLLIDIGNSRIKWALWDGSQLQDFIACDYRDQNDDACFDKLLYDGEIEAIHIASVAKGDVEQGLSRYLQDFYSCDVNFAHSQRKMLGLVNSYANPESLGVDRWLAMLAAYHYGQAAACVVDCGSAMTIDLVRADGQHQGGIIVPGLSMQLESMHHSLARVGKPCPVNNVIGWGRDTASAMMAGGMFSLVGGIEFAMEYAKRDLGGYPRLIMTGGDAPQINPHLSHAYEYHEHLVLEGLALVGKYDNREG